MRSRSRSTAALTAAPCAATRRSSSATPNRQATNASTGTKKPEDPAWKYVEALAGSDIQTNPPATNDAAQASGLTFARRVDQLPSDAVLEEIDAVVDFAHLEETLMREGIQKFADPQKGLLGLIAQKRAELVGA